MLSSYLRLTNNFPRPIENAAELHNIRIPKLHQLVRRLFAAATATAVHHDQLILIGQFEKFAGFEIFIPNVIRSSTNCQLSFL